MRQLEIDATVENLEQVIAFVEEETERAQCSMKAAMQINIAVEEIYINIARYAYAPEVGKAIIQVDQEEKQGQRIMVITFIDRGVPYNPLQKEDPDTTLAADERQIGGLGIFMVKKSMDDMQYAYWDHQNILTLRKTIS